jgi:Ferritin-like domain
VSTGSTRRELLVAGAGAIAAATLVEASAAQAADTPRLTAAQSQFATMRIERLLRVELLMLFSYQHVLGSQILSEHDRSALEPFRAHEEAHVRALTRQLRALGGVPPTPPASAAAADRDLAHRKVKGRLGQLRGAHDALQLLIAVERVVVGAYFVALIKLDEPQLITLLTQIMANDAQHEAIIGELMYRGDAQKAVPYGLVQGVQ